MQLKAITFPLMLPKPGKTYWLQQSLPKVERLKNSYSSRQRCQILVRLPFWRAGKYLAAVAGWLLGVPSASWSSLPIVDPTVLHNKEKIKQLFSKPKHWWFNSTGPLLWATLLVVRANLCIRWPSTKLVPQGVFGQSSIPPYDPACSSMIHKTPSLCSTVEKDILQMEADNLIGQTESNCVQYHILKRNRSGISIAAQHY